jgi:RNA polymerase sigma factor (sigma-70 family)
MVGQQLEAALVDAARAGDQRALDELIAQHLPLVYNVVGRALAQRNDVDDVVQNTMLRVVRGLPGLRDPERFRSWLVAVAMNEVREHRQSRRAVAALDELAELADPGADFVDLTLTRLGLSGQRREVAMATSWLDEDDRQLLSLWWLEEGGHLTRAELVSALELDAHHATVRVARMKGQLETARMVVRALTRSPRCRGLAEVAYGWRGRPTSVWRKRFARHIRECEYCPSAGNEPLIPAERLLATLALTPLPIGYTAYMLGALPSGGAAAASAMSGVAADPGQGPDTFEIPRQSHSGGHDTGSGTGRNGGGRGHSRHGRPRSGGHGHGWIAKLAAKPVLAALAVTSVVGVSLATVYAMGPGDHAAATGQPSRAPIGAGASAVSLAPGSPSAVPSASPSISPSPSTARTSAKPKPSATKATTAKTSAPAKSTATASTGSGSSNATAVDQVLTLINNARAGAGLPAYTITSGLTTSATQHNQTMASGCGLSHQCPGEAAIGDRETAAGVHWTTCGENIGEGGPVSDTDSAIAQMAVGLTQSMLDEKPPNDGHRQNILSSAFTHIGIAVYRDSSGTVWMTQDFSN